MIDVRALPDSPEEIVNIPIAVGALPDEKLFTHTPCF
jgi:hypothetical protein